MIELLAASARLPASSRSPRAGLRGCYPCPAMQWVMVAAWLGVGFGWVLGGRLPLPRVVLRACLVVLVLTQLTVSPLLVVLHVAVASRLLLEVRWPPPLPPPDQHFISSVP